MDLDLGIEPWKLLSALSVLLVIYLLSVVLLDVPASVLGFVVLVISVGIGSVIGRIISERFL